MSGFVPELRPVKLIRTAKRTPKGDCFNAEVRRLLAQADLDRPELLRRMRAEEETGLPTFLYGLIVRRNEVIRFSLSLGLGIAQTQRLLDLSGNRALDLKVLRDAAIAFCLKHHFSVSKSSAFLQRLNLTAI